MCCFHEEKHKCFLATGTGTVTKGTGKRSPVAFRGSGQLCHSLCCFSVPTGKFSLPSWVKRSRGVHASRTEPVSYSLWSETGWAGREEEAHTGTFQCPKHNFCQLLGSVLPKGLWNITDLWSQGALCHPFRWPVMWSFTDDGSFRFLLPGRDWVAKKTNKCELSPPPPFSFLFLFNELEVLSDSQKLSLYFTSL